jgi:hypothetical protein
MRTATRDRWLTDLCLICVVGIVTGCGSVVSITGGSILPRRPAKGAEEDTAFDLANTH